MYERLGVWGYRGRAGLFKPAEQTTRDGGRNVWAYGGVGEAQVSQVNRASTWKSVLLELRSGLQGLSLILYCAGRDSFL